MSGYVSVRASAAIHTVATSYYSPGVLKSQRMDIHIRVCICEGIFSNTHCSYLLVALTTVGGLKVTEDGYSCQGMYL